MQTEVQYRSSAFGRLRRARKIEPDQSIPTRTPLVCYVVDDELGIRQIISDVAHQQGIQTKEFCSVSTLLDAVTELAPDIIFLDLSLDGSDAVDAIRGLSSLTYKGMVQLISGRYEVLLDDVNKIGRGHSLHMLPFLAKPFGEYAIRKVLKDLLTRTSTDSLHQESGVLDTSQNHAPWSASDNQSTITLNQALMNNWLEFWYQPIIDLRTNCVVSAELLARVRHPDYGVIRPLAFLPSADVNDLYALTERALITSLCEWPAFANTGIRLKLAINAPIAALTKLPIPSIIREHRPKVESWPGIILEVTEDQIVRDVALANEVATQLRLYDVGVSIDDFGAGYSSLARLRDIPFCELKLDRSFVANSAGDELKAGLCETIINLAHRFGKLAVAEGVDNTADLTHLRRMGCDMAQGYLVGRPRPKDQFLNVLWKHAFNKSQGRAQSRINQLRQAGANNSSA